MKNYLFSFFFILTINLLVFDIFKSQNLFADQNTTSFEAIKKSSSDDGKTSSSSSSQLQSEFLKKITKLIDLSKKYQQLKKQSLEKNKFSKDQFNNKISLSLDDIISLVFNYSLTSQMLKSRLSATKAIIIAANAGYDAQIYGNSQLIADNSHFNQISNIDNQRTVQVTAGYKKSLLSGSSFDVRATGMYNNQNVTDDNDLNQVKSSPVEDRSNFGSSLQFSLSQSLTRDFLAKKYTKKLSLAKTQAFKASYDVYQKRVELLKNIIDLYFKIKIQQIRYYSLQDMTFQTSQLLKTARVLYSRGLMEEVDMLRLNSRLEIAIDNQNEMLISLKNIWDPFLSELLPNSQSMMKDFSDINPMFVDLKVSSKLDRLDDYCLDQTNLDKKVKKQDQQNINFDKLPNYKSKVLEYDVARQSIELEKILLESDITGSVSYKIGANRPDFVDTVSDSLQADKAKLTLMLNYQKPIGNYAVKSKLWNLTATTTTKRLDQLSFKSSKISEVRVACRSIVYNIGRKKSLEKILVSQKKRADLERSRYSIAKTDAFSVIEATIDALNAELNKKVLAIDLEKQLWHLQITTGSFEDSLYQLITKN